MHKVILLTLLTPTALAVGLPQAHDADAILESQSRLITNTEITAASPVIDSPNLNFNAVAKECSPNVHHATLQALVRTESAFNPYAIGVVGGAIKQPTTLKEAIAAATQLHAEGKNFSMGLAQINRYNLAKYGLDYQTVFEPCRNLKAGAEILSECYGRAGGGSQEALQKALSCYYSGNFRTGFRKDFAGQPSYVDKVKRSATVNSEQAIIKVAIPENPASKALTIPALDPRVNVATTTAATAKVKVRNKPRNQQNLEGEVLVTDRIRTSKNKANWDAFGDW